MGKGVFEMKKYIIISGFHVTDDNRGTAALSYGSLSFCIRKGYLKDGQELINFKYVKKFWKKEFQDRSELFNADGKKWRRSLIHVTVFERWLYDRLHVLFPFTKFGHYLRQTELVAAINGGDGFSDIYGTNIFLRRLPDIQIAMKENIPLMMLPQTLGPFSDKSNYRICRDILQYAKSVHVRDDKFISELHQMGVSYSLEKDLSFYMQPEPFDVQVPSGSIGINISGLCYYNRYNTLAGQFAHYPELINRIITSFQSEGKTVFLIPHSYNYLHPSASNDDFLACREAYQHLRDKTSVQLIDRDMISPQVKYLISRMSFFIGTRMHANFAAIYTDVPLFGLAYSYKFAGAFDANGLNGDLQTATINNLSESGIDDVLVKIVNFYRLSLQK